MDCYYTQAQIETGLSTLYTQFKSYGSHITVLPSTNISTHFLTLKEFILFFFRSYATIVYLLNISFLLDKLRSEIH